MSLSRPQLNLKCMTSQHALFWSGDANIHAYKVLLKCKMSHNFTSLSYIKMLFPSLSSMLWYKLMGVKGYRPTMTFVHDLILNSSYV